MSRIAGQLRKYRDAVRSERIKVGGSRARLLTDNELAAWFTRLEQIARRRNQRLKK